MLKSVWKDLQAQTAERQFLILSALCFPLIVKFALAEFVITDFPITTRNGPLFVDMANFWLGGRAAWNGDYVTLFAEHRHQAEMLRVFGIDNKNFVWSYPPTALFFVAPLGLVGSYIIACLLWTTAGVAAYMGAMRTKEASPPASRGDYRMALAAVVFVPGVFLCAAYGQTALLTSAALAYGVLHARTSPWFAGAVLATFVAKPQLGVMIPVVLLGLRAWRAMWATAACTAGYLALTLVLFGLEPWRLFFEFTVPQQVSIIAHDLLTTELKVSPFFLVAQLGASHTIALMLQLAATAAAAIALYVICRRETDPNRVFFATALAALLSSPYLQAYETPLIALAAARLALAPASSGSKDLTAIFAALTLGLTLTLTIIPRSGISPTPLMFAVMLGFALQRCLRPQTAAAAA